VEPVTVPPEPETPTLWLGKESTPEAKTAETPVASAPAVQPEQIDEVPCPRCGAKLINPENLGWCSKCGFCRSLEEDAAKMESVAPARARMPSFLGASEFLDLLGRAPRWLWVLLAGTAVIALLSLVGNLVLPLASLPRAVWSTAQILLGLLGLFGAQVWALFLIAPGDDKVGAKDAIISGRLWGLTFDRLPETRRQVWLGGWSLAAMLLGVFVVGGLGYWGQFYNPKRVADKGLLQAVAQAAKDKGGDKSLEESVEDVANTQELTKKDEEKRKEEERKKKEQAKIDKRPTVQCVVIGYMVDADKNLTGLVVATLEGERLQYAGTVQRGFTPEASKEVLGRLASLEAPNPLIKGLSMSAVWVKPKLFCEVHQSGADKDGHLISPAFAALLTE